LIRPLHAVANANGITTFYHRTVGLLNADLYRYQFVRRCISNGDSFGLVISLKLISNPELLQLLLNYGVEVQVLRLVELGEKMKTIYRKAMHISS
jgi:hypothetical protein